MEYRNRNGVVAGVYVRGDRKYKIRKDIINLKPDLGHLCLNLKERIISIQILLMCITYNGEYADKEQWLDDIDDWEALY